MSEEKSIEELVLDAFKAQQGINKAFDRRLDGLLELICSLHGIDLNEVRKKLEA